MLKKSKTARMINQLNDLPRRHPRQILNVTILTWKFWSVSREGFKTQANI